MPRRAIVALIWLIIASAALLTSGCLTRRHAFLTRGASAPLPPFMVDGGAQLGVNVRLEQYSDAELATTLTSLAQSPFTQLKQPFYYTPQFDWAMADRLISAVAEHNLTLVPLLDGDPATQFAPPSDPNAYADWAGEFASRYGDTITHYIVWDEPNLTSHWGGEKVNADDYAALLSAAAARIRSADPNAIIVAAPLAPTTETVDSLNLADPVYLQQLYEAGADFDIAAGKPYGFDHPPDDREVDINKLNFSRIILLREVMERNGDAQSPLWAGNWGWNYLPESWSGDESIWGEVSAESQNQYTLAAINRARQEWPWMGTLFLENWEPIEPTDHPIWGFSVAGTPLVRALTEQLPDPNVAQPGFHFASENGVGQNYVGDWRFSAEFGADSSEKYSENGDVRDRMTFTFYGTDVGVRVRRADFRARFYVTVDGEPANARPRDEFGSTIVLDAPDLKDDYLVIEPIATGLEPGVHTVELIAHRGWGQWALNGFSVGNQPSTNTQLYIYGLWGMALLAFILAMRSARQVETGQMPEWWQNSAERYHTLRDRTQLALVGIVASILSLTGWLTWGQQAAGLYRRLGDGSQLALTVATAVVFYITPTFIIYALALVLLLMLISFRPAWGIALIALSMPFYARAGIYKVLVGYRFSPTEIATWLVLIALALHVIVHKLQAKEAQKSQIIAIIVSVGGSLTLFVIEQLNLIPNGWQLLLLQPILLAVLMKALWQKLNSADKAVIALVTVAALSLFVTAKLDVAKNEWWWVIVEPALFYIMLRGARLTSKERFVILDAFIISGLIVSLYGLAQVFLGVDDMITAELGLRRLQSIYGSPNNVSLYIGRILPILLAVTLFGTGSRRIWYTIAAAICGLTMLLTLSKGGLLFGVPVALLILLAFWLRQRQRRVLPYVSAAIVAGIVGFIALLQVPQLAGRLDLLGATSFVRINLWRASIEIIRDNPLLGVGLDNFLYAHRGRYILEAAWREPYLNHPHNLIFDFGTRLGLLGLAVGLWLFYELGNRLRKLITQLNTIPPQWQPIAIGLLAAFGHTVAHGLVDHSYFLIDLAFSFMLMLALTIQLSEHEVQG